MMRWRSTVSIAALGVLAACSSQSSEGPVRAPVGSVESALQSSAASAHVPRALLVAIASVEGGLTIPAERLDIDVDNEVPAAGPLQLRRGKLDTLRRGAELTGVSEVDLRIHADTALHAGALVLAELGTRTGARTDDLASWSAAIEELSGFADDAHREHYAHQVFALLARGGRFEARDGEFIELAPHDLPPSLTLDVSDKIHVLAKAEYDGAEWIPTSCANKCTPGRGGKKVDLVVIHDTEGGWNASVATLQNDGGKSVQYIVDVTGRVGQFVTEDTTAWHAGNSSYNGRSIGIEHVGYATKPFAEAEYAASAKLVDHLATKYGIPRDRAHVVGHDQIPNGKKIAESAAPCSASPKDCQTSANYGGANRHSDPGIWEWATFMARFNGSAKCNDVPELWTCGHEKDKAFRCAAGSVELETCSGPEACTTDEGRDAVCDVSPTSTPASPAPPPSPPATPAAFVEPPETAPAEADAGCAVGRGPAGGTTATVFGVAGALILLGARRRRRS